MIKMIVAMDKNNLIGKKGGLPWYNKEDLTHFKETTMNQTLLMGSTTYLGLPSPLLGRKILILSKNNNIELKAGNAVVVNDINELIKRYEKSEDILYVAGGSSIYQQFLPYASEILLSRMKGDYEGDSYFPSVSNRFILKEIKPYKTFDLEVYQAR